MNEDSKVPLILGRPFLHTTDAIIRVKDKELTLGVGDQRMAFTIDKAMKHPYSTDDTCFSIDIIDEDVDEYLQELLDIADNIWGTFEDGKNGEYTPEESEQIMELSTDEKPPEDESFEEIKQGEHLRIKTSVEEPPTDLELKPLPNNLEYAFLQGESLLPVVISSLLSKDEKTKLLTVLKNHKSAFAWRISNIPGISPSFCKHKINFLDDVKPVVQRQRRLNPNMKDVVKKEIIKLLDAGIIFPISDSPWVSLIHCVPKKGGMTVITNDRNELVPTRTITGWRVCIDYRKLNDSTRKDHFPLPFIDQMLERLAGNEYFCFLDGFS
uniref:uncharacterized protein LOC122597020 n=1 Tax=Erigeron canadensis TaxID=72917 RepID=UPI001CB92952|nr:uncharacterized protein LOC122597020 [Erigeron canadensis]